MSKILTRSNPRADSTRGHLYFKRRTGFRRTLKPQGSGVTVWRD